MMKMYTKILSVTLINWAGSLARFAHSDSLVHKYPPIRNETPRRQVSNRLH